MADAYCFTCKKKKSRRSLRWKMGLGYCDDCWRSKRASENRRGGRGAIHLSGREIHGRVVVVAPRSQAMESFIGKQLAAADSLVNQIIVRDQVDAIFGPETSHPSRNCAKNSSAPGLGTLITAGP